ncbi:14 kDa phosphohistidine phosphatase-like [Argonauta hians]
MPAKTIPPNPKLNGVPIVDIGEQGFSKYVLCKVYDGNNPKDFQYIVRGSTIAKFHADIFDLVDAELEIHGLNCICVGGGKMEHLPEAGSIHVYGRSQGYGQADHSITTELVRESYPHYNSITWDD